MRIIAGKYRGKTLLAPEGRVTRPTADRAREGVFNMLESRLLAEEKHWKDLCVADGFAGTGAMGLEALSRGAQQAVFFENDVAALTCLRQNASAALKDGAQLSFLGDIFSCPEALNVFDIVFSDAPYQKNLTEPALEMLLEKGYVGTKTLCVVESEKTEKIKYPASFRIEKTRIYGRASFDFLTLV